MAPPIHSIIQPSSRRDAQWHSSLPTSNTMRSEAQDVTNMRDRSGIRTAIIVIMITSLLHSPIRAQQPAPQQPSSTRAAGGPTNTHASAANSRSLRPVSLNPHARDFYQLNWGVDLLSVKAVESGQMIRFSYRVLDTSKAASLNDKKADPKLIDQQARVSLIIPSMENVGQLRQSTTPEAGKSYWMVFSNKGAVVKRGDLVRIEIGKFYVDGLEVE